MRVYKNIILSENEFLVLQMALGSEKPLLVFASERRAITQEEYNLSVFSLLKKEYISEYSDADGKFIIQDELQKIFQVLNRSQFVHHISPAEETLSECAVYSLNENLVLAYPGENKNEYIKLRLTSIKEAVQAISDMYISDLVDTAFPMEKAIELNEQGEMEQILAIRKLDATDGRELRSLIVGEVPLKYLIVLKENDTKDCFDYTYLRFENELLNILEDKNDIG